MSGAASIDAVSGEPALQLPARSAVTTRVREHAVVAGATLVFASTFLWQLAGFVFNSVGAHALGPTRYGTLAATVGLLALLAPVMMAMQTMASREMTTLRARHDPAVLAATIRHYRARVLVFAAVAGVLLAVFASPLSSLFHLGSPWGVRIAAVCVALYLPSHFLSGLLQGGERFGRFALETTLEATAKIGLAVVLMGVVWKASTSGMIALALSASIGLVINLVLVHDYVRDRPRDVAPIRVGAGYSVLTLATFGLLALLLASDTLIGKHYLPPREAGLYAGLSLTGKIVFFATSALSIVLFPIISRHQDSGSSSAWSLRAAVLSALTIIATAVLVLVVAPGVVVTALLGARYHSITGTVAWMGAVFGGYAIAYLLATYLLARRRMGVVAALGLALVVQLAGFYAFHSTIHDMIAVEAVAFSTAIACCVAVMLLERRRSRRAARVEAPAGVGT